VKFDKTYWLFIGAAMLGHGVSMAFTWYGLTSSEMTIEANPIASFMFDGLGYIGAFAISTIVLLTVMIIIPYLIRENEKIGLIAAIPELFIVLLVNIDALNDIFMLTGHHVLAGFTYVLLKGFFALMGIPLGV